MRALFASTRGAGHFNPLVPFADVCLRHGHDVVFAGPPSLAGPIESAGYRFWRFDDPPEDELAEVWSRVPSLPPDEQNSAVIGERCGCAREPWTSFAALPGCQATPAGRRFGARRT